MLFSGHVMTVQDRLGPTIWDGGLGAVQRRPCPVADAVDDRRAEICRIGLNPDPTTADRTV
jgi:hypothetical protein